MDVNDRNAQSLVEDQSEMGEHNVSTNKDASQDHAFMKSLLADLSALEQMIETGRIESGVRRIGAEQEMFLVDDAMRPAPVSQEVLKTAREDRLTTELGKFNLEANLSPRALAYSGLREMEAELEELIRISRDAALTCGADVLTRSAPAAGAASASSEREANHCKRDHETRSRNCHAGNSCARSAENYDVTTKLVVCQ